MNFLIRYLIAPASYALTQYALCIMRVGIGLLGIGHGWPKIIGGAAKWYSLGMAMNTIGVTFWPTMWGFCAACTEFFGGIALVLGFGTRIVAFLQICLLTIAFLMHYQKGDSFTVYSFALSLIVVFIGFFIAGSGAWSIDAYMSKQP